MGCITDLDSTAASFQRALRNGVCRCGCGGRWGRPGWSCWAACCLPPPTRTPANTRRSASLRNRASAGPACAVDGTRRDRAGRGTFRITAEADGHGFPTSKIGAEFHGDEAEDGAYLVYAERLSGWLTEVNANLRVELPWSRMRRLELETGEAQVGVTLAPSEARPLLKLTSGDRAGLARTGRPGNPARGGGRERGWRHRSG